MDKRYFVYFLIIVLAFILLDNMNKKEVKVNADSKYTPKRYTVEIDSYNQDSLFNQCSSCKKER